MPILTPEERVGTSVGGKYRLERILAAGGMGTVFAGVHEWTHRPVAVKLLNYEHARDQEIVRRFLQEARAAAQLKHPNVVDVLDMGQDPDGSVYLVLELLEGETLKSRMRRGPLPIAEAAEVLGPIMRALAIAHRKGVVHRDLKPDNIFLARDESENVVPKLLDFGIAKLQHGESSSTRTGAMVGTPHYMSPEQVRGERDVGTAADVWSMGVVLYACLSGRLPYDAESTAGVLAKVITERPVPLLAAAPHLAPELGALIDRALASNPADRFADMGAMWAAVQAAMGSASSNAPAFTVEPAPSDLVAAPTQQMATPAPGATPFAWAAAPPPPDRKRPLWPMLAFAGAVVLIGVAGGGAWIYLRVRPQPIEASSAPLVDVTAAAAAANQQPPVAIPVVAPAAIPEPPVEEPVVAPIEEPVAAPIEEPVAAPIEEPPAEPAVVAPVAPPRTLPSRPHRDREPRRGTGGALILH